MAQLVVPKKLNPLDDVAQYLGIKQATQGLKAQQQQMDTAAMNAQQQQALQAIFKDPASYDPTTKQPTDDALMKANMIHPGIAAEMSKALGRDPVSQEQMKNLQSEQTLRTAQGANLQADNERAVKSAADALKEKQAQEAAGVEIPSSGADVINPLTGKHTHSYQVRIRDPKDGSYTVETRYTDPLYEKPAAADLSVTPFEAWKKENPTAPVSEWLKLEAANKPPVGGSSAVGDFNKTGDDFLSTIPPQWRQTVKKIAQYDEDPTKVASMRGGMREQLTQWVNQVNPEYDAGLFTNRAPTRKAFTTGTQGQQINAINTAIGHIDMLTGLADKLGNGAFVPGNKYWNEIQTAFGADKVTNFDTLKDALAGEVASVLSKGGATVSGIADAQNKIKASNSPQQLKGYIETLIPVMGSKLDALDYQYHQAMGESDPFSALSPESKGILQKHGVKMGASSMQSGPKKGDKQSHLGANYTFDGTQWVKDK